MPVYRPSPAIGLASLCLLLLSAHAGAGAPSRASGVAKPLPGDARRGAVLYQAKCGACHSLDANRVGPAHRGVFGRRVGMVPGFNYSPALKKSGLVWNPANLDRWLSNPVAMVPGTRMGIRVPSAQERADIIVYLRNPSVVR